MKVNKQLADCVSRRMNDLNLSTHDVARISNGQISNGSVWNIINLRVKDVKDDTLAALAKGLSMTVDELQECASDQKQKKTFTHSEIEVLLHEADNLTKKDLEEMRPIWEMVKAEVRRRKAAGDL